MQDLREEVEVRYEGCLQNDRDIGGVEQLDRVWVGLTSDELILLGQEEVEKGDDGSFEFSTLLRADGDG